MPTQAKIDTVTKLTDKTAKAKSIIFADFGGLKHKQLEDLRRKLTAVKAEFVVTKNKLLERALGEQADSVKDFLKHATATLFNFGDEVGGIKETMKFFKTANSGSFKGGLLGKSTLTGSDVEKLSNLPSKEVLLGRLAGQMMAPIQGLHYTLSWNINKLVWVLDGIKSKKK